MEGCCNLFLPPEGAVLSIGLLLFQRRANSTVICSHNKSTRGGSAVDCYATFIKRTVAATDHCSRARTRGRCQRCALAQSFIRLRFVICLNCDPYVATLAPAPYVQIDFALNAGGRNVAQNGLIWRVFIFQALIKLFHSGGLNKARGWWARHCVLPQK